ncbi:MAG: hypothetical protein QOE45_1083 [Frankiaceae bacterium]|nr:hypothetical protein [Frankiaceae bacterium]
MQRVTTEREPRLRRIAGDVRALGLAAPVRAGYEASKRAGGHRLVFGRLRSADAVDAPDTVLAPPRCVPGEARARTLADARTILGGTAPVFGRAVPLALGWHTAPDTGSDWSRAPWWQVDIRSGDRVADVKWTWELGRHRHLLVLARAAWLESADAAWLDALVAHLRSWVAENAPEQGVHWYSNLEIALRALVWLQVLGLAGDRLPPDLARDMYRHLDHGRRHLLADLPYTMTSMRNNHLLGDGLGLIALGTAFRKPRSRAVGERLFDAQLARHMRPDGSMIEDSLSYHRFVTEMLAVRVLLGGAPPAVGDALARSGAFLSRLGVLDGGVPQYGDWDEGRVLGSSGDPLDVAGAAALALSLAGTGANDAWRAAYDECAWYAAPATPLDPPAAVRDGTPVGGGFARSARGPWTAFLKAGGGTSHQHADLCSTAVRYGDRWVVGDPGTGTYNGPIDQRNAFRSSSAHSVLRLGGADQLVPHRAFRWRHAATGVVGPPPDVPGYVVSWGVHDAYRRLPNGGRVARLVVLDDDGVTVADVTEAAPGTPWALTLPLHPDVELDGAEFALRTPGTAEPVRGSEEPYAGWWSETYGSAVPATWLHCSGTVDGPVVWSVRRPGSPAPQRLPDGIRVGTADLHVAFDDDGVTLRAASQVRSVSLRR